jgi:hypothetical protein
VEIAQFYTDNLGSVRTGMIISMIGFKWVLANHAKTTKPNCRNTDGE